jgi:hypothetical protein
MALNKLGIDAVDVKDKRVLIRYTTVDNQPVCPMLQSTY